MAEQTVTKRAADLVQRLRDKGFLRTPDTGVQRAHMAETEPEPVLFAPEGGAELTRARTGRC